MNILQQFITKEIIPLVTGDKFWEQYLSASIANEISPIGIHVAIFVEPYLTYVLEGKKTVESRFGIQKRAPYGQVASGDILLLKVSGGPIVGLCKVTDVWFYSLSPKSLDKLRREFTDALCAHDPDFWKQRSEASFATLMRINYVRNLNPIQFPKTDRRGWVVLRPPLSNSWLSR